MPAQTGRQTNQQIDERRQGQIDRQRPRQTDRLNVVLAQAGKDAGHAVLLEQIVPGMVAFERRRGREVLYREARLDVQMFGHRYAPDRLLDGTARHRLEPFQLPARP